MVHLTGESFDSTVKRKKHALIMFYAPWYSRHYTSLELYVWRHGDQCHVEFVNPYYSNTAGHGFQSKICKT